LDFIAAGNFYDFFLSKRGFLEIRALLLGWKRADSAAPASKTTARLPFLTIQHRSIKRKGYEPSGLSSGRIFSWFHKHSSSDGLFFAETAT
jgi:hypothetical protein